MAASESAHANTAHIADAAIVWHFAIVVTAIATSNVLIANFRRHYLNYRFSLRMQSGLVLAIFIITTATFTVNASRSGQLQLLTCCKLKLLLLY